MTLFGTAAAMAPPDDTIVWVRSDGTRRWSTAIARAEGAKSAPLIAPAWFAKIPDGRIPLAPTGVFDVGAARGRVLVIDYWASWCPPCLLELPHLQRLHETRGPKGLEILAINADEDASTAVEAARRLGLTVRIGLNDPAFFRDLGVQKLRLPTTFVVDREGRIRGRWNGYRPGDEADIAKLVDELLTPQGKDSGRSIADVFTGQDRLRVLWQRDLQGRTDGVIGLPAGHASGVRAVASAGGALTSLAGDGSTVQRRAVASWAGRILDLGAGDDGSPRVVAFRPGGTTLGVVSVPSGEARELTVPAPIFDATIAADARIAVATQAGAIVLDLTGSAARPLAGTETVRDVAGALALRADGSIGTLDPPSAWPAKIERAGRLLVARDDGAAAGPETMVASAFGRFLPGERRQLAVATYDGRVLLLDAEAGEIVFDASWPDVHDLSAVDLDGDGHDELLVASGRSVAAVGKR
jgi:thiol-disulfide isomerase/thioredoxin